MIVVEVALRATSTTTISSDGQLPYSIDDHLIVCVLTLWNRRSRGVCHLAKQLGLWSPPVAMP